MTKILFSKSISVPGHPEREFFYEKYWEPGFEKPLWRWGEIIHYSSENTCAYTMNSHLLARPNIKRYIKRWYHVQA